MQVTRATFIPLLAAGNADRIDPGAVRDEYCGDLTVVYTFGPQFGRRVVTHADLEQLELPPHALRRSALEHLEVLAGRAEFHGQPPALMLSFDGLESSLLLANDLWGRLQGSVPGELVVGVPARDVVVVTGSQSQAGLEKARRCVERVFFAGDDNLLSRTLLVRRGNGWEPFDRPAGARNAPRAHGPAMRHRGPDQPPRQYQDHPSWPGERVRPVSGPSRVTGVPVGPGPLGPVPLGGPVPAGPGRAASPSHTGSIPPVGQFGGPRHGGPGMNHTGSMPPVGMTSTGSMPPVGMNHTGSMPPVGMNHTGSMPPVGMTNTGSMPPVPPMDPAHRVRPREEYLPNPADVAPYSAMPYSAMPYSAMPYSAMPYSAMPNSTSPYGVSPASEYLHSRGARPAQPQQYVQPKPTYQEPYPTGGYPEHRPEPRGYEPSRAADPVRSFEDDRSYDDRGYEAGRALDSGRAFDGGRGYDSGRSREDAFDNRPVSSADSSRYDSDGGAHGYSDQPQYPGSWGRGATPTRSTRPELRTGPRARFSR